MPGPVQVLSLASKMNVRAQAAMVIAAVVKGQSLTRALESVEAGRDNALLQALCYGVIRYWYRLDGIARQLFDKPLKAKDQDVHTLVLCGLYQLQEMRIPEHAAVSETVAGTAGLGKPWARKLVNALLRRYQRESEHLLAKIEYDSQATSLHPQWLLDRLNKNWPDDIDAIIDANNGRAPMSLRVNLAHGSRDNYLARLEQEGIAANMIEHTEAGIQLTEPCEVSALPGFADGDVSVQDAAAQQAAMLLDAKGNERILDACAAPGGKTAHILERLAAANQQAEVVALDVDGERLSRVEENLDRLGLQAAVAVGDASTPDEWWDGKLFDRILLDAPCSATGVIRRHPDIRLLRRDSDIAQLASQQAAILDSLWSVLAPGGCLLYATCSMLTEENSQVVATFLAKQDDASEQQIDVDWGRQCVVGRQIMSGERGMDGFYYARLIKK